MRVCSSCGDLPEINYHLDTFHKLALCNDIVVLLNYLELQIEENSVKYVLDSYEEFTIKRLLNILRSAACPWYILGFVSKECAYALKVSRDRHTIGVISEVLEHCQESLNYDR